MVKKSHVNTTNIILNISVRLYFESLSQQVTSEFNSYFKNNRSEKKE